MKLALCTTTIHHAPALKLLRKYSDDVPFFVALDQRSSGICFADVEQCLWLNTGAQMNWKVSHALPWNSLSRRNIAFLEALKWGADAIISWDTDNFPVDELYFNNFIAVLRGDWNGLSTAAYKGDWFDPGDLLVPKTKHRGFPPFEISEPIYSPVICVKVGVSAGLVLGNPDIDAMTRIVNAPMIQQITELGHTGIVVGPHNWTVFNSQNTAVIRELVPAWFMMPDVGRMDDIYASLIVQRVAREYNYHVHFGQPFTYQQRHDHDLIKDLRAEIDGYSNVVRLAELLDPIPLIGRNVIEDVRKIYETLLHCQFLPKASIEAGLVWLEDCETVL